MSAKRGPTDGQDDSSRLEISAEHEIGTRDPYAIRTLDDVAKDEMYEPEAYDGLDSTLGMTESGERQHVASESIETKAYERDEDAEEDEERRGYSESEEQRWDPRRAYSDDSVLLDDTDDQDDESITDDGPDMGAVWASESINAPLFHAAELRSSDADSSDAANHQLPWELQDPADLREANKSLIETLDVADLREEPTPEPRRISRPPPLPSMLSERRRMSTADQPMELEPQEVVYDGHFWERRSFKRAAQVALASVVGIVLGWMAWGGPNEPVDAELEAADAGVEAASEPIVTALDAGLTPDAAAEEPKKSDEDEEDTVAAARAPIEEPKPEPTIDEVAPVAAAADNGCAVLIDSKPSNASIWIEGQAIGKTPYRGKQPCGRAKFVVKRENYKSQEVTRRLRDDGLNKINLELERPTYRVQVTSTPSRAVVRVNGKKVGKTPMAVSLPGYTKVKLVIEKKDHKAWKRTMVPRDTSKAVKATLTPSKKKKGSKKRRSDG